MAAKRQTPTANSAMPPGQKRSLIYPTAEGLVWLGFAFLLLYQGWLRGFNLVSLLASFLLGLWILNYLWVWQRYRLKNLIVRRSVDGPVFAGEMFTATLAIENPTRHHQPSLRVVDAGDEYFRGWVIPQLRRHSTWQAQYRLRLPRRGRYTWPPVLVTTGHPFGLVRRSVRVAASEPVIVLPRLGRLNRQRMHRLLQQQPGYSNKRPVVRHPGAQTDFYGLREFRDGDSPRWIHWRTTARVGELMVREFEEPPIDNLILVLDAWLPRPANELRVKLAQVVAENREIIRSLLAAGPVPDPQRRQAKEIALARKADPFRKPLEALERAISLAATICWEWFRSPGGQVALIIADKPGSMIIRDTGPRQVYALLERLALVEGSPTPTLDGLSDSFPERLPSAPVVVVSTRSDGLADDLAVRLRRAVTMIDVTHGPVGDFFVTEPTGGAGNGALAQRSS